MVNDGSCPTLKSDAYSVGKTLMDLSERCMKDFPRTDFPKCKGKEYMMYILHKCSFQASYSFQFVD